MNLRNIFGPLTEPRHGPCKPKQPRCLTCALSLCPNPVVARRRQEAQNPGTPPPPGCLFSEAVCPDRHRGLRRQNTSDFWSRGLHDTETRTVNSQTANPDALALAVAQTSLQSPGLQRRRCTVGARPVEVRTHRSGKLQCSSKLTPKEYKKEPTILRSLDPFASAGAGVPGLRCELQEAQSLESEASEDFRSTAVWVMWAQRYKTTTSIERV